MWFYHKRCVSSYLTLAFAPKQVHKQANAQLRGLRHDTTPNHYLEWATKWQASGADIIGGCCGIRVKHITKLAQDVVNRQ